MALKFKMVAESHCDTCREWKATDWSELGFLSEIAFREQVLVQLAERGWKYEAGRLTCPQCLAKTGA